MRSRVLFDPFVGTEELGHLEMVGAIVHQLTRKMTDAQIEDSAFAPYFVDHTAGVYPTAASGFPWTAASMAVKGDPIADLTEDLAAEGAIRLWANGCPFGCCLPKSNQAGNRYCLCDLLPVRCCVEIGKKSGFWYLIFRQDMI